MKFIIYSSYVTVLLPIFDKSIVGHLHIDPSNVFSKAYLTVVTFPNTKSFNAYYRFWATKCIKLALAYYKNWDGWRFVFIVKMERLFEDTHGKWNI
jgi:hypothetical protein